MIALPVLYYGLNHKPPRSPKREGRSANTAQAMLNISTNVTTAGKWFRQITNKMKLLSLLLFLTACTAPDMRPQVTFVVGEKYTSIVLRDVPNVYNVPGKVDNIELTKKLFALYYGQDTTLTTKVLFMKRWFK